MSGSDRARPAGLRRALVRVGSVFAFALFPAAISLTLLSDAWRRGNFALDFHHAFWPAGRSVLDGTFAYPASIEVALGQSDPYVYPPLTAVLLSPFALLPRTTADIAFIVFLAVSLLGGLRLLGVRDWRCYGLVFLWPPVLAGLQTGNLSLLLVLGLGLLWVSRQYALRAGLTAAVLVSAKLFLWPALAWLLITKRYRAAVAAAVLGIVLNAAAWLVIGAGSISHYVHIVRRASMLQAPETYTVPALAGDLGAPDAVGLALMWSVVALLLAACWRVRHDDARSFGLIVIVALVASPIVWLHYLALLAVPIALTRPRLSWPWFVPLALVAAPGQGNGEPPVTLVALAVLTVVTVACCLSQRWLARPAGGQLGLEV